MATWALLQYLGLMVAYFYVPEFLQVDLWYVPVSLAFSLGVLGNMYYQWRQCPVTVTPCDNDDSVTHLGDPPLKSG